MSKPSVVPVPKRIGVSQIIINGQERKIIPVETATYYSIDFAQNPDAILYSTKLTQCPVLLIKNWNEKEGNYANTVVTMAHFFPNNAYDEDTAKKNIAKAVDDFKQAGGVVNEKTSFQILGGGLLPGVTLTQSANGVMADVLKDIGYKFKMLEGSIIYFPKDKHNEIFVDRNSTQILKNGELITKANDSMPTESLRQVYASLPSDYNDMANKYADKVSKAESGIDIKPMQAMLSLYEAKSLMAKQSLGDARS